MTRLGSDTLRAYVSECDSHLSDQRGVFASTEVRRTAVGYELDTIARFRLPPVVFPTSVKHEVFDDGKVALDYIAKHHFRRFDEILEQATKAAVVAWQKEIERGQEGAR